MKCLANNEEDSNQMNEMRREMCDLGRDVTKFLGDYIAGGVNVNNVNIFEKELKQIGKKLQDRIEREEKSLYTLCRLSIITTARS